MGATLPGVQPAQQFNDVSGSMQSRWALARLAQLLISACRLLVGDTKHLPRKSAQ
jgi:hypothetical protein